MQFTNLNQIEKYLTQLVQKQIATTDDVRSVVAKTVSEKVESEVYAKYPNPERYERRGRRGGLADPDNVEMVSLQNNGKAVRVIYENMTEGNDSLRGELLTPVIENGDKENWYNPNGVWSEPREFINPSIEELKNGNELTDAVKQSLRKAGLELK